MTRFVLPVAGILCLGLLSGCTPAPAPTVLPDVVVEHAGTTEFETNEFVVAVRAQELAHALAWNSSDFTISELTESTAPDVITEVYEYYASLARQGFPPTVYVGPPIWAPVSVTQTGDSAEIVVCMATQDRTIESGGEETSYDLTTGSLRTWTYTLTSSGIAVKDPSSDSGDECDASAAEVVTFDPAPTLPEKISEGDIRKPTGE